MQWINRLWFEGHWAAWLLAPLALLFWLISAIRRSLFKWGVKPQSHPGVPVLVVGNISVGGNGKTPVVLKCVEWLNELGYQPGILSRGYGGQCQSFPHQVTQEDSANWVGDEPKLMALRQLCPVVIDPKRGRGAAHLAALGCNVIVCDDGLQHYALRRNIEWVVMDDRAVGNGCLLPMGPLRELPERLNSVDAIIHNGNKVYHPNAVAMNLTPTQFVNVLNPSETLGVDEFVSSIKGKYVHALAGIGAPQRFFKTLSDLGMSDFATQAFVDHHEFSAEDIPAGITLMTEKDAVKCQSFAHEQCWYLKVDATLPSSLKDQLGKHVQQCADVLPQVDKG